MDRRPCLRLCLVCAVAFDAVHALKPPAAPRFLVVVVDPNVLVATARDAAIRAPGHATCAATALALVAALALSLGARAFLGLLGLRSTAIPRLLPAALSRRGHDVVVQQPQV